MICASATLRAIAVSASAPKFRSFLRCLRKKILLFALHFSMCYGDQIFTQLGGRKDRVNYRAAYSDHLSPRLLRFRHFNLSLVNYAARKRALWDCAAIFIEQGGLHAARLSRLYGAYKQRAYRELA